MIDNQRLTNVRRNANKTLQGIKTVNQIQELATLPVCRNANKTLQGIKTLGVQEVSRVSLEGRNANKTLQGIKTKIRLYRIPSPLCRNANKTLQGIKTRLRNSPPKVQRGSKR